MMIRLSALALVAVAACAPSQTATTWPFNPPLDDFRATALLDLRSLNEKVAGETGFVRVDSNGDFLRGDGKPVRFWCVVSDTGREKPWTKRPLGAQTEPDLARHARFLAKRGVNMVRHHRQLSPDLSANPNAALTDINEKERDAIWRAVAAYRKEGIYSTISPYWGVPMKFSKAWGIDGDVNQSALGLLFFDEKLRAAYKAWLRKLYAEKNPYTGIPLAQDASVAIIQIQNEDSLLFWTVNNIQGPQRQKLMGLYGQFLTRKYGTLAKASAAWGDARDKDDAPAAGRMGLLNIWEMTQARTGGMAARLSDQAEFYSRTMHAFNADIVKFLRTELGCKQLVNAGNWKTADAARLNDLERWSYTGAEVDAVNFYTGGIHKGPNEGWAIVNGDKFTSESALLSPKALPINLKQTVGRPILVTESAWVMPNGFAAEGPFLIAAYSALNGIDGYYWFATGDEGWTPPQSANGYMPSQAKWLFGNPDMLGTFPAAALAYRMGYIRRGTPAVVENRSLADLWARRTPIIAEEASFDPNRDTGDIARASAVKTAVNALAFFIGPVQVAFDADPALTKAVNLNAYMDSATGAVRSSTGEITLNPERGYCTINAPKVQGVAAHFGRAPLHRLADVTFSSRNAFGAAMAVTMDDKPLSDSARILVQFGTQSRPTGWVEAPTHITLEGGKSVPGMEVKSYGGAPWQVVSAQLDVQIKNPKLKKATALDADGNALKPVPLTRTGDSVKFAFPSGSLYVILE